MTARSALSTRLPPAPSATHELVEALRARQAIACLQLARELLLAEPEFEAAFPAGPRPQGGTVAAALARLRAPWPFAESPDPLVEELAVLASAGDGPHGLDDRAARIRLALRAIACAEGHPAAHAAGAILRAQADWVFGRGDEVRPCLLRAVAKASNRRTQAGAWHHLAIAHADCGDLVRALEMLALATRAAPDSQPTRFLAGVFHAAHGDAAAAAHHLAHAGPSAPTLRRHVTRLPAQLRALGRRGFALRGAARDALFRWIDLHFAPHEGVALDASAT